MHLPQNVSAVSPTADEMAEARGWAAAHLEDGEPSKPGEPFWSFRYDGKKSNAFLASWTRKDSSRQLDAQRTQRTRTYVDPATGLEIRCVSVEYADFPAVEWTVYFRNTSQKNTSILKDIRATDLRMERGEGGEFVLRGIKGDDNTPDSYEPYEQTLGPNVTKTFAAVGGRPTQKSFPYYNLAMPGGGRMLAIGWPGQWSATFARDAKTGLHVTAGQELTNLYLKPGEEIRTPLVVLFFWKGTDAVRAQNLWRRWMFAHNLPRPGGKPLEPIYSFCDGGYFPGLKIDVASERHFIDVLAKERVRLDYWWIDAGWYPCNDWGQTGTWEVDPKRFPKGIKEVSDHVHAKGTKLIVWFEPERVTDGSWLTKNHPDWILGGAGGGLLNLGNTAARTWVTNHVDQLIRQQGIDLYRQDFNMDPLPFWRGNDAPDRQGMTENLHVQGYLAYWDELIRRHPGMLIDSCASGGRRNDLETLRRAVPLLRSDYQSFAGDPTWAIGNQGHTYGLSSWIPFFGQGVYYSPKQFVYCVRSHMCPASAIVTDVRKNEMDWNLYRRLVDQWRQVAGCFFGDYYPLLPYNLSEEQWVAWQFDRPEQGEGMVQAFRRGKSDDTRKTFRLMGLDPAAQYEVVDLDQGTPKVVGGKELMEQGLAVEIGEKPGAALVKYRKRGSTTKHVDSRQVWIAPNRCQVRL
jgi:alpha-galactosidase